jgi:hypothetical protein
MIKSVSTVLLPNFKGTPLVTNSEEMFAPTVLIVNALLALQEFSPNYVPIITSAPSRISTTEVKLSLPILS